MSQAKQSSGLPYPVRFVIGVVLAVGGFYVSNNVHIEALKELELKGILFDPGRALASIGVLIMLFPAVEAFFVKPLEEAISTRSENLESTFAEAESLKAEMAKMKSEYEKRIVDTEAAAREQIQAQIKEAQAIRGQLVAEAAAKADDLVRQAREDIENDRNRVLTELRIHVVDLSLSAAAKIVGENMDSEKNRRLVQEFIDGVEVKA